MVSKEIKLRIHEESDLFSEYDPDQEMLDEGVHDYLVSNYLNKHRFNRDQYTLRIISDEPLNEKSVEERIKNYYAGQKDNVAFNVKKVTIKEAVCWIVGAALLALWLILSADKSSVLIEILSAIASVIVWEAITIAVMERPQMVQEEKAFDKVLNARFVFETRKEE